MIIDKMSAEKAIRAIEEIDRMDVNSMTHDQLLDQAYKMQAVLLELLTGDNNLRCDIAILHREKAEVREKLKRKYKKVDELKQKVDILTISERSLQSENDALTEELKYLTCRVHGSTGPIVEPDCSKVDEVDALKSANTRSQPKVVKPGCRHKGAASAKQLQIIRNKADSQIPLTAKPKVKSTIALLGESEGPSTAVTNTKTKIHKKHPIFGSSMAGDLTSRAGNVPTIRTQDQPTEELRFFRRGRNLHRKIIQMPTQQE